ncbi:MAG: hypothetical protein IAE89_11905 [Anaerolineae bacterium]|nr:hypothetical protein [Anaerolineae bacterium]
MASPNYGRALIAGAFLAVLGVVIFILLWASLGGAGVANAPRLFISMCVPPAVIGLVFGLYALFGRKLLAVTVAPPAPEPEAFDEPLDEEID